MKIFKFGGASVSTASAIRNVAELIRMDPGKKIIVLSAMASVTNELEVLCRRYYKKESELDRLLEGIKDFHFRIMGQLGLENQQCRMVADLFTQLQKNIRKNPSLRYDYEYDQIVSFGELISTAVLSAYLNRRKISNQWQDIRHSLRTDATYREAAVDWKWSSMLMNNQFNFRDTDLYVTQGFIGSTETNQTTTLGREGSDFSAAILGSLLNAESVTIWKNVPGVLNADPALFSDACMLDELSYKEAIELAYSGAKVIHPKTIKPLRNGNIPLLVKSFDHPEQAGTIIHTIRYPLELPPIFIVKEDQVLITLSPDDFSFIGSDMMADIFELFKSRRIKVNLIQQSAIDLSLCIDEPEFGLDTLIQKLRERYDVKYNTGLMLATIRYYNRSAIEKMIKNRKIFINQKSRRTARLILK